MKISPSTFRIIAGILAMGAAAAFVPNSCHIANLPASTTTTTCFASEVDTDGTLEASTSSTKFPFSDRQVRYAYDEWRLIYSKGDFDPKRFKSFKANHRTLVISNLKAREKAAEDGRPMPQWMSLNEYGDYSMEEYESMMRGEDLGGANQSSSSSETESGEQRSDDSSTNYSNGQVTEYQDAFGRTIRSTKAVNQDSSLESAAMDSSYAMNIDGDESSRGTIIIPNGENDQTSQRGTQVIGTDQRGTQVIGTSSGAARGTQVIGTASGTARGTQVIGTSSGAARGTQVIGTAAGAQGGTQVIASAYGAGSQIRGTQVVNGSGTQVLSTNGAASYGTQVINGSGGQSYDTQDPGDEEDFDYEPTAGTQIIPKNEGGTQIIPKGNNDSAGGTMLVDSEEGTRLIEKGDKDALSNIFGAIFGDSEKSEDTNNDIGKRGTMVIKRSIKAPEQKKSKNLFSIFDSSSSTEEEEEETKEETEESKSNDLFGFLSPKEESTTVKATEVEEESKTGGGIFSLFGGNVQSANPRPVRTSISLQKQNAKKPTVSKSQRKTKLIPDETEKETGVPSILSFFGGAKKVDENETVRNPNSRPTLILKKPKTNQFSLFSGKKSEASTTNKNPVIAAQIARQKEVAERAAAKKAETVKDRNARFEQRQQKRAAATKRREALAQSRKPVTTEAKPTKSPFSFFGAIGMKATPPTLKKWRQNRDGTITGLIYDSKSFKDGTRITTSPIPRGAKRGTTVKTNGGSQYSLE